MGHTPSKTIILVSIDAQQFDRIDEFVANEAFASRNEFVEKALKEKLRRVRDGRLFREAAKPDPSFEVSIAEEGLEIEQWPVY